MSGHIIKVACEGWFDEQYFILFSPDEYEKAGSLYRLSEEIGPALVVGMRGWDDLLIRGADGESFSVPMLPMSQSLIARCSISGHEDLEPDPGVEGRYRWYVKPLLFGGDPACSSNITWVDQKQHRDLVLWWNQKYLELRGETDVGGK